MARPSDFQWKGVSTLAKPPPGVPPTAHLWSRVVVVLVDRRLQPLCIWWSLLNHSQTATKNTHLLRAGKEGQVAVVQVHQQRGIHLHKR